MIYDPSRLLIIAGPCSLENEAVTLEVANALAAWQAQNPAANVIFKGSFDKANRTSLSSSRGPGLEHGLELLQAAKEATGLPVLTDFHDATQPGKLARVCDVLQVPAFLCRQTDLLVAAAETGCVVNVKKGQFVSPHEMRYVVDKLAGAREVWLTERGSTFGYQTLTVDMRSFPQLAALGHPTIMDATHSVQQPGAAAGTTGGQRAFVPVLARAALAAGAHGVFLETHPDPANAISDGPNQVPLADVTALLDQLLALWQALQTLPPVVLKNA